MSKDLVITDEAAKALATARLQSTVDNLYQSIERDGRGVDTLPALPSSAARKELTQRRRNLHAMLRPISLAAGELDSVRKAVAGLLGAYLNIRTDPSSAVAGYVAHVSDQPLFAIMAAIDDFRHRRVFDIGPNGEKIPFTIDHAPSAFRLLDQVKKRAEDVQAEYYKIGRILAITKTTDGPYISPEEQARVAASLADLTATMGRSLATTREQDRRKVSVEAQEARDRAKGIIEGAHRSRQLITG